MTQQSYIGSRRERKVILASALASFVANTLAPRLSYRLRWTTRLSARGMLVYVLYRTFEVFAVRTWGPVLFKRLADSATALQTEAARELGHEPTPQEAGDYFRRRWKARHAPTQGHPPDTPRGAPG